jgi:hypothetical protein
MSRWEGSLRTTEKPTLKGVYPVVNLDLQAARMKAWIRGNYSRRKYDIGKSIYHWRRRGQDARFSS